MDQAAQTCICSRPTPDGYLCHVCTINMRGNLHGVAYLARGLDEKRARYSAITYSHGRSRSADTPIPYDPRVTTITAAALNALRPAAALVWDRRRPAVYVNPHSLGAVATWLTSHTTWIRTQPEAPNIAAAIERAHDQLTRLFDKPPDRLYLGVCGATRDAGATCDEALYVEARTITGHRDRVEAGTAATTCVCGYTHDVKARRDDIAYQLGRYQATMTELVRLAPILVADGVTHAKLKRLSADRRFVSVGARKVSNTRGQWVEVPTYRIADVQHAIEAAAGNTRPRTGENATLSA